MNAMREQTDAQFRPYVVASVGTQIGTTLLILEIQNTGKSAATDLTLRMNKAFYFNGNINAENIAALPAFTQLIEALAPGARLQFVLGIGHTLFSNGITEGVAPKVFTVKAEYGFAVKRFSEQHIIDLRPLLHTVRIDDPIATEIKALRESVDNAMRK